MYIGNNKNKNHEYSRVHLIITGRVQGVAFRYYAKNIADSLGVKGWIRNIEKGNVELVIEGKRQIIDQMIDWCKKGPGMAKVDNVEIDRKTYTGEYSDFNIR